MLLLLTIVGIIIIGITMWWMFRRDNKSGQVGGGGVSVCVSERKNAMDAMKTLTSCLDSSSSAPPKYCCASVDDPRQKSESCVPCEDMRAPCWMATSQTKCSDPNLSKYCTWSQGSCKNKRGAPAIAKTVPCTSNLPKMCMDMSPIKYAEGANDEEEEDYDFSDLF